MKISEKNISQLRWFLERLENETYPETPAEPHLSITKKMIEYFQEKFPLKPTDKILDVGCGQGVALDIFSKNGSKATGITLNRKDLSICSQKGHQVFQMDQSFLEFNDCSFDLIWCRHCLEHSVMPCFTLHGFFRVLKPLGYLYVEVPAPDTACGHQKNNNHYSVLGKSMWTELIRRAGFNLLETLDISFNVPSGPDTYWAFILRKPNTE